MTRLTPTRTLIAAALALSLPFGAALSQEETDAAATDAMPTATLELSEGIVEIVLRKDLAPAHVARITELANDGFYDGLAFHRVIPGFMAQTGDPLGNGTGGSDLADLEAEFSNEDFARGTLGMARTADPNSANSQFFIVTAPAPHLNGQYTLFGEVTSGMEFVHSIKEGTGPNGMVTGEPDRIVSLRVSDPE